MGTEYRPEARSLFATEAVAYEPSLHQHPAYSVLDAAGGWWQHRRAYWASLGARDAGTRPATFVRGPSAFTEESGNLGAITGDSQFSPVLTELLVAFYSEPGDTVLDPFCGGPIRGFVATMMDRSYVGTDVRPEQIEANDEAYPDLGLWSVGDARVPTDEAYGLVLTCPPYHDVERYSDQPDDLSAMTWPEFSEAHGEAVRVAASSVRADGWVVWVVGDFRAPTGELRGFPGFVAEQFARAGLRVWNRHIVRQPLVTAQMRWRQSWEATRKATTVHSEVIVGRPA